MIPGPEGGGATLLGAAGFVPHAPPNYLLNRIRPLGMHLARHGFRHLANRKYRHPIPLPSPLQSAAAPDSPRRPKRPPSPHEKIEERMVASGSGGNWCEFRGVAGNRMVEGDS